MEVRNITKIVRNMTLYKNKVNKNKFELNDTEFEMMRYITKRDFRLSSEISDYLNVDKGLVSRMSKKLEKLGYIKIETDTLDLRKKKLIALPKAFSIKEDVENEEIDFYNTSLSVLSSEEKEIYLKLTEKVYLETKKLRKEGFINVKH